jgi:serine/threonine protein kinase
VAELVRGVGDVPVNDGEGRVVRKLLRELPAEWKLIPNIEIRARDGRMYEVDCIVVAPHAIYVLEVKHWHGTIDGDDNWWVHNGRSDRSPVGAINRKAKVLKGLLRDAGGGVGSASVESFVVLAAEPARLDLSEGARSHTLLLDEIVPALSDTSRLPGSPRHVPDLPDLAARALAPLVYERRGPQRVGKWRILETLGQDDECSVYRAANALAAGAPEVRLTVWHLSTYRMTPEQRSARRREVLRDYSAVARMGPHRLIVGARDAFEDGEDVVVVTDDPVGVPLPMRLRSGPALDDDNRLTWIDDLADAVGHAHAHDVIHRRLSPEAVLVVSGGVRLSGFGHARIAGEDTIRHDPDSVAGLGAQYLAPEVVDPSLGKATERADLFGLAALTWTIWSGCPLSRRWQADGSRPGRPDGMPARLWQAIEPLLDVRPSRRTTTLDELRAAVSDALVRPANEMLPVALVEYPVGALIADRYEVIGKLGSGGFSTVYRAVDTIAGVERAVKVLRQGVGDNDVVREVRALDRIQHPNIVRVFSIDTTPTSPRQWYITSAIAPGVPLNGARQSSVDEAVAIAEQLLDACIDCHEAGIVHRDIKPSNVLYDRESRHVTLIDFNIASESGSTVHTTAGTPAYQPPDPDPDRWSPDPDLFAIGVLLFELLTGQHPYVDRQDVSAGVRSLTSVRPDAPEGLAQFLAKATNPSRKARFGSAVAMRAALHDALAAAPAAAGGEPDRRIDAMPGGAAADATTRQLEPTVRPDPEPTVPGGAPPAGESGTPASVVEGEPRSARAEPGGERRRSVRRAVIAVAVLVLAGIAAAIGLIARGDDDPGSAAGTTVATAPATPPTDAEPVGQDCPDDFPVKGNINEAGEKIYHLPGWRFYDDTWPERCFVDQAAAEAAGFRASKVT